MSSGTGLHRPAPDVPAPGVPGARPVIALGRPDRRPLPALGVLVDRAAVRWSALGAATAVALYFAFWRLTAAAPTSDEPIYVTAGWQYVHGGFRLNREHPPTAKLLMGLAQLLLGQGLASARVAAALMGLAAAVVLFLWLRGAVGWWTALGAATLWCVMPDVVQGNVHFQRFAQLESFMVPFALMSMAAAWRWFRTGHWAWAVASGALLGLSATSKVSSAVLLPAFAVLLAGRGPVRRSVVHGLLHLAAFGAVFVAVYLPMGARSSFEYMLAFQSRHDAAGHLIHLAGTRTAHPPWWANLWFAANGLGVPAALALLVGVLAAVLNHRRPLVAFVGTGLALLAVFYLVVAKVALPFYYTAWLGAAAVLAPLGVQALWRVTRAGWLRIAARTVAALVVVVLAGAAVGSAVAIHRLHPTGLALVARTLAQHDRAGEVYLTNAEPWAYAVYDSGSVTATANPHHGPYTAILYGEDSGVPVDRIATDAVGGHPSWFTRYDLGGALLYIPHGELVLVGHDLVLRPAAR